jgi:hypothetical protein
MDKLQNLTTSVSMFRYIHALASDILKNTETLGIENWNLEDHWQSNIAKPYSTSERIAFEIMQITHIKRTRSNLFFYRDRA